MAKLTKQIINKYSKYFLITFTILSLLSGIVAYLHPNILNNNNKTAQAAFPTSRDPYQWPFSRDSIWNMPIGSNAQYAVTNMPAPDTYAGDEHHIYRLQNPKPTQFEQGVLPLDDGMISDIPSGDSTNRVATVIDNNGDFYQIQPGRRNSATSNVTGYVRDQAAELYSGQLDAEGRRCVKQVAGACYLNIKGKGIDGSHWGSGLSAIGGGLKSGDLTSAEDIRHALNIEISGWKYLKCNDGDTNFNDFKAKGFMWPADRNDSYACPNGYGGNLDYFRMGALLALKPDLDLNSLGLQTDAAKKMAKAFQDYGGYVTDDSYGVNSNSTIFNFTYEKEVASEFKAKYGYDFNIYWDTGSLRQSPFFKDMDKIITQLNVITNNTPTNIGGGGTPRAPLAPCFVGEANCTNTTVTSTTTSAPATTSNPVTSTTSTTSVPVSSSCTSSTVTGGGGKSVATIMPMGDSITQADKYPGSQTEETSYRAPEWLKLTSSGYSNKINFVGSQVGTNVNNTVDPNFIAYGGYTYKDFYLGGWGSPANHYTNQINLHNPDIVQIFLGTNGDTQENDKLYLNKMIDDARTKNPAVKFLLAKPYYYDQSKTDFVLTQTVANKSTTQSPITLFNPYINTYNINQGSDTVDGIHNNSSGADKMGSAFATAIKPLIDSVLTGGGSSVVTNCNSSTTSNPTTSTSTTTSSTSSICNGVNLTGTAFGATPSYNNDTTVTFDKAFDGNISTFFDYQNSDGGYVGLDLGITNKATLNRVCVFPRGGVDGNNNSLYNRSNGSIIQGSNDNINYTNIVTLNGFNDNQWKDVTTTNTTPYRYYRYLSPNGSYGNLAEIKFFGVVSNTTSSSTSSIGSSTSTTSTSTSSVNSNDCLI
jgi:hypothetical protein